MRSSSFSKKKGKRCNIEDRKDQDICFLPFTFNGVTYLKAIRTATGCIGPKIKTWDQTSGECRDAEVFDDRNYVIVACV